MWIGEVDIPQSLIEAHRAGELVIFVGAGASVNPPASLPNFRDLAATIAKESGIQVNDLDLKHTDTFLADLKESHRVDVHLRVKTLIGDPASRPNRLHEAIANLAACGPTIRVVTTNYDLHLSTALQQITGRPARQFVGPALPLGDNFDGIVYIHGSLEDDPEHLIVTDADFGRAYLRYAWAARFLERMFTKYGVLFIGYSHDDVVMSYLARGLGPDTRRYILTPDPDGPQWRRLGIKTIGYPSDSHDHVYKTLEGWADRERMGLLDHQQRVAALLSAGPPQVPEDVSYLEQIIVDRDTVSFFTEHARGEPWLTWISDYPAFKQLFDLNVDPTASVRQLAYWFAEHYVMSADMTQVALSVVREFGGRLTLETWSAIGHQMSQRRTDARPEYLGPWITLLVQNAPQINGDLPWLGYILFTASLSGEHHAALLLFDYLTEPSMILERSFFGVEPTRFGVKIEGKRYDLERAWKDVFTPHLSNIAEDLLPIVDRNLRRAHQLLAAAYPPDNGRDPLSYQRSAIEPHEQDQFDQPAGILIDAARDCLQVLLELGRGAAYLDAWAATDVTLLRRLAVHGWTHRSDVDATTKIMWLHERRWLFELPLRHEVFRLIAENLADASASAAGALVAQALAGRGDEDVTE